VIASWKPKSACAPGSTTRASVSTWTISRPGIEDAARWIVQSGIKLVGVDYLSVAPPGLGTPVHRVLLEANTVIVEGLNLSAVHAGAYQLWCLPLKLVGSDGAPARAVLAPIDDALR